MRRDVESPSSQLTRVLAENEILRDELARERVRSARATTYGAQLLARLDELEALLREYAERHPCVDAHATSRDTTCSCGLRGRMHDVETWRVQMIAP